MRVLLDIHTVLWAVLSPSSLSSPAGAIIADQSNVILVSAASAWEIAGRLIGEHRDLFDRIIAAQALQEDIAVLSADAKLDSLGSDGSGKSRPPSRRDKVQSLPMQ